MYSVVSWCLGASFPPSLTLTLSCSRSTQRTPPIMYCMQYSYTVVTITADIMWCTSTLAVTARSDFLMRRTRDLSLVCHLYKICICPSFYYVVTKQNLMFVKVFIILVVSIVHSGASLTMTLSVERRRRRRRTTTLVAMMKTSVPDTPPTPTCSRTCASRNLVRHCCCDTRVCMNLRYTSSKYRLLVMLLSVD